MPPLPPVTQTLLLVNVAVFFLERLLGVSFAGAFALWPIGSGAFSPWQLVTYAFLHMDFGHLFFNMLGLWMFGGALEQVWGERRFAAFYAASVIAAALTQLLVNIVLGSPAVTVGASGGIFGILLGFAMIFPERRVLLEFVLPVKAKYLALIYGAMELYQGVFVRGSGIAHLAHLGGMLGAWLTMRYWRGQPPFRWRR